MQSRRIGGVSFPWIDAREPAGSEIDPSSAVVLPARVRVEGLAGEGVRLRV
jgi:hypothetical protein